MVGASPGQQIQCQALCHELYEKKDKIGVYNLPFGWELWILICNQQYIMC